MKRIVEYEFDKNEWRGLLTYLDKTEYSPHGYMGIPEGTIDDGKSSDFDSCSKFSTFTSTFTSSKKIGFEVLLKVKDSDLAKIIDSHFSELE